MHDISRKFAPSSICSFFTKTDEIHGYKTRFSNSGNLYINVSETNQQLRSFTRFGAELYNGIPAEIRQNPQKKKAFKNYVHEFVISFANWERLRWGTHYFQKNQKNLVFISVLDFLFT